MSDEEAIAALSALKGIGVWTAEMILLFCLQKPDILSYGDLAILRGMRMVYRHREMTKEKFEKYRRRLSPYNSVASLYFWGGCRWGDPGTDRSRAKEKRFKMTREQMVKICQERDKSYEGKFYLAVMSTKIVCNPGCSSRVPLERNMVFFDRLKKHLMRDTDHAKDA
ncbi:Ada metal-binding domain-containing protein [Mobiluncus curtisii]|uniref:Ada metal-binding domain-containing protein n=1 Tax=Mobiluncus curtisii TaxID=2051 RepID=UPI0020160EAD|nr:Ada metal-binding domain-containing protein [Mobiluncus curtisii]